MNIPEGWKLVPVEPTEEMRAAAEHEIERSAVLNYGAAPNYEDLWSWMLTAAPTPPAQWWKLVREYKDEDLFECRVCRQQFEVHKAGIPLPEECPNCNDRPGPTPLAQGDEPVLWYEAEESTRGKDIRHVIGSMLYSTRLSVTKPETNNPVWPLYTRPDNSGLRKAAGEALNLLDKLGSGPTIENLRAALEGK